jgi:hypothetical protein
LKRLSDLQAAYNHARIDARASDKARGAAEHAHAEASVSLVALSEHLEAFETETAARRSLTLLTRLMAAWRGQEEKAGRPWAAARPPRGRAPAGAARICIPRALSSQQHSGRSGRQSHRWFIHRLGLRLKLIGEIKQPICRRVARQMARMLTRTTSLFPQVFGGKGPRCAVL